MVASRSVATLLLSLALFLGSVWLVPEVSGQDISVRRQFELEYVGSAMWGLRIDVARSGDYVYCAMANGLQILDISEPTNPTLVKRVFLDRVASCLTLEGDRLFVGYDNGYVQLFDVSSPTQPVSIADVFASGGSFNEYRKEVWELVLQDTLLYVAFESGLNILNISDVSHPEIIGSFQTSEEWWISHAVEVVDGIAYLAAGKLWIIDVSDPTNPTEISQYSTYEYASDLEISGNILFVADKSNSDPSVYSRLTAVDVSDPEFPETIGSYLIRGNMNSIDMLDSIIYCATEYSGVIVLDVSSPSSLALAGCLFPPLGRAWTVEISNNLAFVCNIAPSATTFGNPIDVCEGDSLAISHPSDSVAPEGSLAILDVSDLANPEMIGYFPFSCWANTVAVYDDHAFVCSEVGGMAIVDVSNPVEMRVVSTLDTPGGTDTKAAVKDSLVLIASRLKGLQIVDISDITDPHIIGSDSASSWALAVVVQGSHAYLIDYPTGLMIFDISDPTAPDLIASLPTPGAALGVAVKNQYAYVSDKSSGLQVINISDPTSPELIGNYANPAYPGRRMGKMALQEYLLFVDGDSVIEILDISEPTIPEFLGVVSASTGNYDLTVAGDHLYLAHSWSGIEVIDITDPTAPTSVSTYDSPWDALGVAAVGDMAYIADHSSLIAMRIPDPTSIEEPPTRGELLPNWYQLHQNYPNPFNPSTVISYEIPRSSFTTMAVYNIMGQEVRTLINERQSSGHHTVTWDGRDSHGNPVASGVYFYRLTTSDVSHTKKMLLLK